MDNIWHIVECKGGTVLTAHDVLTRAGIDCLAFVEIKRRTPRGRAKEKRGKREAYAVSSFSRYLFADLSAIESQYVFTKVSQQKSYIYGAMGRGEALYALSDRDFNPLRSIKHESGRYKGKLMHHEYSRAEHSRENMNRIYGQSVERPVFSEGDLVEFVRGGFRGLVYEVTGFGRDGQIHMRGDAKFFGGLDLVKVDDPFIIKKVA